MFEWADLAGPAIALGALAGVGVLYGGWSLRRARSAPARITSGAHLAVPVTVVAGDRQRRGVAVRDGEAVRVLTSRQHLVLTAATFATAALEKPQAKAHGPSSATADLHTFADEDGADVQVGASAEWDPALAALAGQPNTAPLSHSELVRALVSRPLVAAAGVALLLGIGFHILWWSGHEEVATVTSVVSGGYSCGVKWLDGGVQRSAKVSCDPNALSTMRIRALPWPLKGSAIDESGSFGAATAASLGGTVLALGAAGGPALRRSRRTPVSLEPVTERSVSADDRQPSELSMRELLTAVAEKEGWADDPGTPAPKWGRWEDIRMALYGRHWIILLLLLLGALLPPNVAFAFRATLLLVALGVLVYNLKVCVHEYREIRAAWRALWTSTWDYALTRTTGNVWLLFLMMGDEPRWSVMLPLQDHPARTGRCEVRGELANNGSIHVKIDDQLWVPSSPVVQVDEEYVEDVRADFEERLTDGVAQAAPTGDPERGKEPLQSEDSKPIQ